MAKTQIKKKQNTTFHEEFRQDHQRNIQQKKHQILRAISKKKIDKIPDSKFFVVNSNPEFLRFRVPEVPNILKLVGYLEVQDT